MYWLSARVLHYIYREKIDSLGFFQLNPMISSRAQSSLLGRSQVDLEENWKNQRYYRQKRIKTKTEYDWQGEVKKGTFDEAEIRCGQECHFLGYEMYIWHDWYGVWSRNPNFTWLTWSVVKKVKVNIENKSVSNY
jgi:hypothetical protein